MSSAPSSIDITRRSKLPVSTRYISPHQSPPATYTPRHLPTKTPPSPPLSTSSMVTPPPSSPRPPRVIHWETRNAENTSPTTRRPLTHRESTDSIRENERFSPIPWVMSPPRSPPPLSLYTSVALLHYHIHHDSSTSPECMIPQIIQAPPATENVIPSPARTNSSPHRSSTASAQSSPAATTRVTRVLTEDKALEEFIAVEKALTKSPYVLPQDVANSSTSNKTMDSETPKPENGVILDPENEMEGDSLPEPEVSESERDGLVDLVEGYSRDDDTEVQSLPSSPFFEHTKPAKPVDDEPPPSPIANNLPQELISPALSPQPVPEENDNIDHIEDLASPLFDNDTEKSTPPQSDPGENDNDHVEDPTPALPVSNSTEKSTPKDDEVPLATESESTVSRMPSIQRRGQEYLAQFLAKRKSKSSSSAPKPHPILPQNPERGTQSPLTIILYAFIFLSLIANVFLMMKVYRLQTDMQSPERRLDKVMTPGRVGETFEIFTTPSSDWRIWTRQKEEKIEIESPALPPEVDTMTTQKWSISNMLNAQPKVDVPENTTIEHTITDEEEGMLEALSGRAQLFIYGILVTILRL